jgi:D-xylose transport system substrate-binding protein
MNQSKLKISIAILAAFLLVFVLAGVAVLVFTGAELAPKNLIVLVVSSVLGAGLALAAVIVISNFFGRRFALSEGQAKQLQKSVQDLSQGKFSAPAENIRIDSGGAGMEVLLGDFYQNITNVLSQTRRLTEDLGALSQQIIDQSENLSRAAGSQSQSVEETGQSISEIDRGIRDIHERVDGLKNLSQETSSSGFEMMTNIQQVSELAGELAGFVRDLVTAISQMASNIKSVASASESLSATSTQTAVSVREIDQNTQEIRKRAEESARVSASARERGVKAGELIGTWAEGMEKIESTVSDSTKMMAELTESSEAIGNIVNVISDIASETHLLSLNASIMAAKAGEHGRGFMVVASEIKDLARRTSESTKEIEALINRTRKSIRRSQEGIGQAYENAKQGIQLSQEARSAIGQVLEGMELSAKYSQEIAHATEEQAKVSNQVYQSSTEVDERTQLIKTAMREQEDSSAFLKERAEKMRELTERVKIATKEQADSSQQVSRAMEDLTSAVELIRKTTQDQSKASSGIIKAMNQVKKAADLIAISVANVTNTASSVLDQSLILGAEMKDFELPVLEPKMKVGLVLDGLREERWRREHAEFTKRCERLGARVLDGVADGNHDRQMKLCEELIAQGAQVLVIVPVDGGRAATAVEIAHKHNIKVMAYDRLIKNCELDLFITYAYDQVGEKMVEYALRKKPSGNYFLLYGSEADTNAVWLKKGQRAALEPWLRKGTVQLIGESWTPDWSPEKAYQITRNLLESGKRPDVVIASNDGTAGGAIRALKESGLSGKALVTGMDAELDACRRIARGEQALTVYMQVRLQALRGAEAAVMLLRGQEIPGSNHFINNGRIDVPSILLQPILVDADNMREVIVADGYHSEKDIYRT